VVLRGPTQETDEADIAKKLRLIHADFMRAFDSLPEVVALAIVEELLRRTEEQLVAVFPFPEFAATQDYFRARFRQARKMLSRPPSTNSPAYLSASSRSKIFLAGYSLDRPASASPVFVQAAQEMPKKDLAGIWSLIGATIGRVRELAENNDLKVDVCITSVPVEGATVDMHPVSYKGGRRRKTKSTLSNLPRGLYAYKEVTLPGYNKIHSCSDDICALDLVTPNRPFVSCSLVAGPETTYGGECLTDEERSERSKCEPAAP